MIAHCTRCNAFGKVRIPDKEDRESFSKFPSTSQGRWRYCRDCGGSGFAQPIAWEWDGLYVRPEVISKQPDFYGGPTPEWDN